MKSNRAPFLIATAAAVILFAAALFLFFTRIISPGDSSPEPAAALGLGSQTVEGLVREVLEEGQVELGEVTQDYQILEVEILEGEFAGLIMEVDYGQRQLRPEGLDLKPGDRIFLTVGMGFDNTLQTQFQDFRRTGPLLILFATFVFFSVLISGWKGVRGLIGMAISIAVIIFYIIPQILDGKDPILVSVSGAFFLMAVTLYLVYGWTLKTHAAVLGTLTSLILTALLASYFVDLTRLTGYGSEDALFLLQQSAGRINMQGIVLGGMLIGALGVLDDLVITQASVVFELFGLNPELPVRDLYKRAMRVGQDHVAATVNTLVLAYAGAALPMFLLFSISGTEIGYLLNLEYVAEEVVRTMVGSLGLIAAVPLTTYLSCLIAIRSVKGGGVWDLLGPASSGEDSGHGHHH
jgi:uncharacterized membrane protein